MVKKQEKVTCSLSNAASHRELDLFLHFLERLVVHFMDTRLLFFFKKFGKTHVESYDLGRFGWFGCGSAAPDRVDGTSVPAC